MISHAAFISLIYYKSSHIHEIHFARIYQYYTFYCEYFSHLIKLKYYCVSDNKSNYIT